MTSEERPPNAFDPDDPVWKKAAEEYRSVVQMIQDTGRHIWVINGAYLVVVAIILNPLVEAVPPLSNSSLAMRGGAGLLLSLLWLASFERNYAYYNYRIRLARSLEGKLGFTAFEHGAKLGEEGAVFVEGQKPVTMPTIGKLGSIQSFTRTLIVVFLVAFAVVTAIGLARLLAA